VGYNYDEVLRERYKKYRGLKSFKNSDWDCYENLPEEFS